MDDRHQKKSWLAEAGLRIPLNALVEISPLFALDARDVKRHVLKIPKLTDQNIYIE